MKNLFILSSAAIMLVFISCGQSTGNPALPAGSGSPDSAANNGVLPPSASPDNANNSSLADTAYQANDSTKKHKDSSKLK